MKTKFVSILLCLLILPAACTSSPKPAAESAEHESQAAATAPEYLSLNRYNEFVEAQSENMAILLEVRRELAQDADPQEVYALSVLIRTLETHVAVARNLADLSLLAGTEQFAGSPYIRQRFSETAEMLEQDLSEIGMQNLALNKSAYKDVSAIFTGYLYDLEKLIKLVQNDLQALERS